ncbi:MAG: hypothetical protein GY750_03550 [Lentisphaerae bacterium]|nr:hypothetical protein [Lentisphaerota bacterium]MCP4100493.1 hypothetical protein [Lentisphaerota bacterium]
MKKFLIIISAVLSLALFTSGCRTPWLINNEQPGKTCVLLKKQLLIVKLKTYPAKYEKDFGEYFRLHMVKLLGKNQIVYSGDLLSMQDAFNKANGTSNADKFKVKTNEFVTLGQALGCSTVLCGVICVKERPELSVEVKLWWLDTSNGETLLTLRKNFDTTNRYERKDFSNYLKQSLTVIKNESQQRSVFIRYCAEKTADKFKTIAEFK